MTRRRAALAVVLAVMAIALGGGIWARQQALARRTLLMRTDPDAILGDPRARAIALTDGLRVFDRTCAGCHGAEGRGNTVSGVPDLTDDDFLYGGGKASEIEQIVLHGIRSGDTRGWNLASMPAFASARPYARDTLPALAPVQIEALIVFLRAANGNGGYDRAAIDRGRALFTGGAGCWDCHSGDGRGDSAIGAPNLVDGKWLKGDGSEAAIRLTLHRGLAGISPAFARTLSPDEARAVAVYVASLHPSSK